MLKFGGVLKMGALKKATPLRHGDFGYVKIAPETNSPSLPLKIHGFRWTFFLFVLGRIVPSISMIVSYIQYLSFEFG